MTIDKKNQILKSISGSYNGSNLDSLLDRAFEVGRDFAFDEFCKTRSKYGLNKLPDFILVRELRKRIDTLEYEIKCKNEEIVSVLRVAEDKQKATLEVQRENMYRKQHKELNNWRRRAQELARAVGSLKVEITRLKARL